MTMWLPNLENRSGSRYRAIAAALRDDVREGRLAPGDKLPPQRDLAWRLGVTVGTVSRAYAEAQRAGLVDSHVGRGTFVLGGASDTHAVTAERNVLDLVHNNGVDAVLNREGAPGGIVEMAANHPSPGPVGDLLAPVMAELAEPAALERVCGYEEWGGHSAHREAGAAWIARYAGFAPSPEELIVTPGVQAGISAIMAALVRPGETILTEALTWPGIRAQAAHAGQRIATVAMDEQGVIPDALERACRATGASVLYTMPNLHNPTTTTTPEARRREIVRVAQAYGVILVEDDIYGFLLDDPPPAYAALAPDQAVYINSLSKSVAPGLRIGWVRAPAALRQRVLSAVRSISVMASPITGEIAARAIAGGAAHETAAFQRTEAQHRSAMARKMLGPAVRSLPPRAMHGWLRLPDGWRGSDFVTECQRRSVMVTRGDAFDPAGTDDTAHVRVCFCGVADRERLRAGLTVVADVLNAPAGGDLMLV